MCEGEWSWVQLSFAAWALFLVPAHSGEWRGEIQLLWSPEVPTCLPTWASNCCLEKQHTKDIDKQGLLSCTDILVFVPQGPSYLVFHYFLNFIFFVYFPLFRGSWRKWNETVEFPECSPSSHQLCAVRGDVTSGPELTLCWAVALKIQVQQEPEEAQPLIIHTAP